MKYEQAFDGEWIQPKRKGYKIKCCKCGLVHRLDFRLVKEGKKNFIQFKPYRIY